MSLEQQIKIITDLENKISKLGSVEAKVKFLLGCPNVQAFLASCPFLQKYLLTVDLESQLALLSVFVLDQGPIVFQGLNTLQDPKPSLNSLIQSLLPVETNYSALGGIIGYHLKILQLIQENNSPPQATVSECSFIKPEGLDISQETPTVKKYIRQGIEALPYMAEIYPVGGAGDR